jgi:hypothetical protein
LPDTGAFIDATQGEKRSRAAASVGSSLPGRQDRAGGLMLHTNKRMASARRIFVSKRF